MNIQNNRAVEVLYSTTYVEDYLDLVEFLPDEIQRYVSRLIALDAESQSHFSKVCEYFKELSDLTKREKESNCQEHTPATNEIAKIRGNMILTLMKSQQLGDEKIQIAQQIQDSADNRIRQLEIDRKMLDSLQRQAELADASTSSIALREREAQLRNNPTESNSTTERTIKRVRRARLGLPIIPPKSSSSSTVAAAATSSQSQRHSLNADAEKRSDPSSSISRPSVVVPNTSVTAQGEKEKEKAKAPNSTSQETRKENSSSSSAPPPLKKRNMDSESSNSTREASETVSERRSEMVTRNPKKENKKKAQGKVEQKKVTAGAVSSTTRSSSTKRKARQMDVDDSPPFSNVDPDEPTYCLCDQISYGDMIGCDNDLCPIEWFHFSCVSLTSKPKGKWFCPKCRGDRPNVMKPKEVFLKELDKYNRDREEK